MQNVSDKQSWAMPALAIVVDSPWLTAHNRAVICATNLKSAYRDMLELLIEIDENNFYFQLEKPDLHSYCTEILDLPNHTAYDFVNVIRTSRLVPELAHAVLSGRTSISKARRVCSVITPFNKAEWIELICECALPLIKRAVAMANPRAAVEESMRYVSGDVLELKFAVSEEWVDLLNDTKDRLSQKLNRAVSTEEALFILMAEFKQKNDPVKKAERAKAKREKKSTAVFAKSGASDQERSNEVRKAVSGFANATTQANSSDMHIARHRPMDVEHEVTLRDQGQCTHRDATGVRCRQKRWLHKHHVTEFAKGGRHELGNLETLCSGHHRMKHRPS